MLNSYASESSRYYLTQDSGWHLFDLIGKRPECDYQSFRLWTAIEEPGESTLGSRALLKMNEERDSGHFILNIDRPSHDAHPCPSPYSGLTHTTHTHTHTHTVSRLLFLSPFYIFCWYSWVLALQWTRPYTAVYWCIRLLFISFSVFVSSFFMPPCWTCLFALLLSVIQPLGTSSVVRPADLWIDLRCRFSWCPITSTAIDSKPKYTNGINTIGSAIVVQRSTIEGEQHDDRNIS